MIFLYGIVIVGGGGVGDADDATDADSAHQFDELLLLPLLCFFFIYPSLVFDVAIYNSQF